MTMSVTWLCCNIIAYYVRGRRFKKVVRSLSGWRVSLTKTPWTETLPGQRHALDRDPLDKDMPRQRTPGQRHALDREPLDRDMP